MNNNQPITVSDPKFKSPAEIEAMELTAEQWNQLYSLEVAGLNRPQVVEFLAVKRINPAAEVFMGEEVTEPLKWWKSAEGEEIQEPEWRDEQTGEVVITEPEKQVKPKRQQHKGK